MKIASWNINGIRSSEDIFLKFLEEFKPDIIGLQETKAHPDKLSFMLKFHPEYNAIWDWCKDRTGYSGTAVFYRKELEVSKERIGLNIPKFDIEGRVLAIDLPDNYTFITAYFPFGGNGKIEYKTEFCNEIYKYVNDLQNEGKKVILSGDINIALEKIDLYESHQDITSPIFMPKLRNWLKSYLELGYIDTYRELHPNTTQYSWWSYSDPTRLVNHGMRLDYIFIPKEDKSRLNESNILSKSFGSDHCPVMLDVSL